MKRALAPFVSLPVHGDLDFHHRRVRDSVRGGSSTRQKFSELLRVDRGERHVVGDDFTVLTADLAVLYSHLRRTQERKKKKTFNWLIGRYDPAHCKRLKDGYKRVLG